MAELLISLASQNPKRWKVVRHLNAWGVFSKHQSLQSNGPCASRELRGQLCPNIEPDINSGDMGVLEIMALIRNKGLGPDLIPGNR